MGQQHQAGSDSFVTCRTFFKLMQCYFDNQIDDSRFRGIIYGLGQGALPPCVPVPVVVGGPPTPSTGTPPMHPHGSPPGVGMGMPGIGLGLGSHPRHGHSLSRPALLQHGSTSPVLPHDGSGGPVGNHSHTAPTMAPTPPQPRPQADSYGMLGHGHGPGTATPTHAPRDYAQQAMSMSVGAQMGHAGPAGLGLGYSPPQSVTTPGSGVLGLGEQGALQLQRHRTPSPDHQPYPGVRKVRAILEAVPLHSIRLTPWAAGFAIRRHYFTHGWRWRLQGAQWPRRARVVSVLERCS